MDVKENVFEFDRLSIKKEFNEDSMNDNLDTLVKAVCMNATKNINLK